MRPLDGVRILDFFWLGAGPTASLLLSHLGADVIKVESQARLDKIRESGPYPPGSAPDVDKSGVFTSLNYGKKSLTLNLAHPEAREIVYDLVQHCDVVTNNFKASTMGRFGLSFEQLSERNPRIVYITMSTMGAEGPCASYGAYGSHLAAMAGINALAGREGELPIGLGSLFPDFGCNPFHASAAILAALHHVQKTGKGVDIDISQLESTLHLLGPQLKLASLTHEQPRRTGSQHPWRVPRGIYRCGGDDEWVALSISNDEQWSRLVTLLAPEIQADWSSWDTFIARQRDRGGVEAAVGKWAAARNKWDASRELRAAGVPASPVNHLRDQIEVDPDLRAEFVQVPLDDVNATVQRIPMLSEGSPVPARPPRLGEHTFDLLHYLLGYSPEHIGRLVADDVLT